jgi:UDP-N-acetylmuramate--alanine ligase
MFFVKKRIHCIGIGGAGMCPLAEVMYKNGQKVTGSDELKTDVTKRLESLGITIQYNHKPDLLKDSDLLVYSSAIKPDNEELIYAREHGITCMKRSEAMGDIMRAMFCIGVAGTHGKTTTTSLIGTIFQDAKKDPTVILGGVFRESDSNAIVGDGMILITEADEYDRSFLKMHPSIGVVTGIEEDHLDTYGDSDNLKKAFIEYLQKIPFYGMAVLCSDDDVLNSIHSHIDKEIITYGTSQDADYMAVNVRPDKGRCEFEVKYKKEVLGKIDLPLIGLHNVNNAMAAIAVSSEMRIPFKTIQSSLKNFKGVKRRFETIGSEKNITVIDDYAHHPTEIKATLQAAKDSGFNRVIAVFQPHLYSRTRDFLDEFAESLFDADFSIVTGIYRARDEVIEGVSGSSIVESMHKKGDSKSIYVEKMDDIADTLMPVLNPGDCIILMGAGDIWEIGEGLLKRIRHG